MTLTPSVRAISLCSFPCLAKSFACASFVATSTRECRFTLPMATCPAAATSIGFAAQGSIAVFWTSPTNRRRARCTEKPKFPARATLDRPTPFQGGGPHALRNQFGKKKNKDKDLKEKYLCLFLLLGFQILSVSSTKLLILLAVSAQLACLGRPGEGQTVLSHLLEAIQLASHAC
jgi:hypothetical protein